MSMIQLTREFHFSAGHTLHNYEGKCANLHGHNYRCKVTLQGITHWNSDMLIDFGDFKSKVGTILEQYDHHFLINEDDPRAEALKAIDPTVVTVPANPTAEYLVEEIREEIIAATFMGYPPNDIFVERLNRYNGTDPIIFEVSVELWETDDCSAISSHFVEKKIRHSGEPWTDNRSDQIKVFDPVMAQWEREWEAVHYPEEAPDIPSRWGEEDYSDKQADLLEEI